jgi:hypothetical protein
MANNTIQSDVFKFVALRPPVSIDKKNQEINFISDNRQAEQTPVGGLVKTFDTKDGTKIPEQVSKFIETNKYDLLYPENDGNPLLSSIFEFVSTIEKEGFTADFLSSGIVNFLDSEISSFLDKTATITILNNTWDRYYAFYILSKTENQNLENLTKNLRVFHLLQQIVKGNLNNYETFKKIITATPAISSLFTNLPKPLIKIETPKVEPPDPQTVKEYKNLWTQLVDTHRALEEVKNIKFDTKLTTETKDIKTPNKETGIEEKGKLTFVKSSLVVNKKSFDSLHSNTKAILNTFNLAESNFQLSEPVTRLQHKLEKFYRSASMIEDAEFLNHMPVEAKSIEGIASLAGKFTENIIPYSHGTSIRASIKPLGIGDLKVVKQKIRKYVAGEVAHIENVLRGEYKEKKHRVLDRTEDIFTITNEVDEETTKDTQTTERFELKKESEKTVQEQMSVQAGVTVSGSYGTVTFGAHGDFAYSTSSQESNKNSSNFAREVIDKSVSKIQKKTKEERTTKKLHEVEEINTHGIDNKDKPDHAVGIYRWVDKYYEAQIYNYGKRMMFEFIIPEPAAFFEYAQTHKPKKDIIPPPVPYKYIWNGGLKTAGLITHKDINVENYHMYIRDYNVQGVTPPPLQFRTISTSIVKEAMPANGQPHVANAKLVVPSGYIAKQGIKFECSAYFSNQYPTVEVTLGNKIYRLVGNPSLPNNHINDSSIVFSWFYPETPIDISVNLYDIGSFTLNAVADIERMPELYEQWQIHTFEKIMTAYQAMQIEYEQKLAAQEFQQGIAITGQNPRINREIEKTELKKQCVKMLMDTYRFGSFDAMKVDRETSLPDFDIFDAINEGKTIQFFEQAFEWENLTYLFYPYFWARIDQWVHKSTTYDNDPLFTKFLQAGSSRVVLPVHPAYNDAIMYFLENNGAIWKGGEPPRLNDPLFISLADELRNQTDDLANATAEGEPWEVILPTTLVYLQKDSDLPTFI